MGGCWERLIGVARRILEGMLLWPVLTTLIAEVMAILKARPLIPVSPDPNNPTILTPAMILTQKMTPVTMPRGDFDKTDLYLVTLEKHHTWTDDKPSIQVDDVVQMKDSQDVRNNWPIGLVVKTLPSKQQTTKFARWKLK